MTTIFWALAALVLLIACGGEEGFESAPPPDYQYTTPWDETVSFIDEDDEGHLWLCDRVRSSYRRHLVECDGMTPEDALAELPYFGCEQGARVLSYSAIECSDTVTCAQWVERDYPACDRVIMLPPEAL